MSRFRVVFFGTPDFAVESLKSLIQDEHFEVVGVVTQPDRPAGRRMRLTPSPVKQLALERGLPVLTPEKASAPEILEELARYRAEVGVVVAFGQILSQSLLNLFPHGCVNVHGSLLPRWRGAAPIQRALMAGDAESGVSLQKIGRQLDAGEVLGTRHVILDENVDAVSLYQQLKILGADLLTVELMDFLRGNLVAHPQDEKGVTVAPKIAKSEAEIHWSHSARQIFNQVRGLTLGPASWTRGRGGQMVKVWRTRIVSEDRVGEPGRVQAIDDEGVVVECGLGLLKLLEVQPESKARMSALDYVRGYGVELAMQLGPGHAP